MKSILVLTLSFICLVGQAAQAVKISQKPCCAKHIARKANAPFGASRMAGDIRTFWPQNQVLNVYFMDGTKRQQSSAWQRFQQIDKLVNLTFVRSTNPKAQIRVSFNPDNGHWSFMGREALQVATKEPTMNLALKAGILGDAGYEWDRVVLHEVCHAIGIVHEHSNPRGGVQWNIPYVLWYYKTTQNWTEQEIYEQVIFKYSMSHLRATEVDPKSIMMYPIAMEMTLNRYYVGWNDKLSPTDIWFLGQLYPVALKNQKTSSKSKAISYHENSNPIDYRNVAFNADVLPGSQRPTPGPERDQDPGHSWAVYPTRLSSSRKVAHLGRHYIWLSGRRLLLQPALASIPRVLV